MPSLPMICAHKSGSSIKIPRMITRIPEPIVQTFGSIPINMVEALRSRVNRISETTRLAVMIYGRHLSFFSATKLPPRMIGSSGSTHGARAVSSPATYESSAVTSIFRTLRLYTVNGFLQGGCRPLCSFVTTAVNLHKCVLGGDAVFLA